MSAVGTNASVEYQDDWFWSFRGICTEYQQSDPNIKASLFICKLICRNYIATKNCERLFLKTIPKSKIRGESRSLHKEQKKSCLGEKSFLTEWKRRNLTPQRAYICLHLGLAVMKKQMFLSKECLCLQLTIATERLSAFTFYTLRYTLRSWVRHVSRVTRASQTRYSITTARAVIEGMGKSTGKSSQPSSSCPLETAQTMFRHTVNNSCPCLS